MNQLLSTTFLLALATTALAQQPEPKGFNRKLKTGTPDLDLSRRLNAAETPLPTDRLRYQTLMATGTSAMAMPPLRLRIVRDPESGRPIYIENRSPNPSPNARKARRSAAATTFSFLNQVRSVLVIQDPDQSFTIQQTVTDELGQTHHRLTQTHRGLPVYGAELTVHQTGGEVTHLMGQYRNVPTTLGTSPRLSLADAGEAAMQHVGRKAIVQMFGQNILKMKPVDGNLCVWAGDGTTNVPARLAYDLTIRPNLMERWQYIIDAETGAVLHRFNNTCGIDGPVNATARDLNGVSRTFKTYLQGSTYHLIDASRTMYNKTQSKIPDSPVGGLMVLDARNTYGKDLKAYYLTSTNNTNWSPTAASAQYNGGIAYEYFLKTFNRNSINDKGGTVLSIVNVNDPETGKGMDNAYWNGEYMFYGNGDKGFKPLAGSLDVAGHEMSHGVIQNTANLVYEGQSGAINESFADIFGVLIDRDDWTVGEDVVKAAVFPSGAMRSMSNPNQGGSQRDPNGYQPKTMTQYISTTEDNGGVHINSGIPNFAFYQIATAIGKDKAEQIYYRALSTYLTRTSKFIDLRLAVIKAATDISRSATSAEVNAVKTAFDNVGITETSSTPKQENPTLPTATGSDLIAVVQTSDNKLLSTPYPTVAFTARSTSGLVRRPSLTDDGRFAYFVSSDKRIRAVDMTRPVSETVVSNETRWANVAISKDGTKLAALSDSPDGKIYVYSFALAKWQTFTLYNPTSANGVTTGEVKYADSFEWDYAGENIVYDAYNELTNDDGDDVSFWDVGFINVWDGARKNFATGRIDKLFTDLDEGVSIGNPSFAKTSPDIIAFDYFDESDDTYFVVTANIEKGDLEVAYENNDLGFPSYSRTDNAVVFGYKANNGNPGVGIVSLEADKITPKAGSEKALYTNAKWPVWYTNVARALPTKTAQTITFNAIPNRTLAEGNLTLAGTSSANLPVGFSVRSGPAELVGTNQLKLTGLGTVTIRAFQEGNTQTFAATPVDRTFEVTKATQTITFSAIPDRNISEGNLTLSGTSSANLPVVFSVRSGPATLVGTNQLRFTGTGSVTVRAAQEGNDQFGAATPIDRTFQVLAILALEPNWAGQVRIYPNPARTDVTVELPQGVVWQSAELTNGNGAVVQKQTGTLGSTLRMSVGTLPPGVYLLNINTNEGQVRRKLLRE